MLVVAGAREVAILNMGSVGGSSLLPHKTLKESSTIASFSMSRDGTEALLSMVSRELHLWDLQSQRLISTYDGYCQDRFVIGACLGGEEDGLVLSGSSNGNVHIWNKRSAKMITTRKGHSQTVNAVSWSPSDSGLFVSGSDDHGVNLWGIEPSTLVD